MTKIVFFFTLIICFVNCYSQNILILNNNGYLVIDNGAHLVIENPSINAIQTIGTGGNIVSESYNDVVDWKIGGNIGNYIIPFTSVDHIKIPFSYEVSTVGVGGNEVLFSTYRTNNNNNPLPINTGVLDGCIENNSLNTIDRFWRVDARGYTQLPSVNLEFTYDDGPSEMGGGNTILEERLKAERYNTLTNTWEVPDKLFGSANTSVNKVFGANVSFPDFFPIWTLVDTNSVIEPKLESTFLDTNICEGAGLVVNLIGADNYQWIAPGLNQGVLFYPQNSERYEVIGSLLNGCSDTLIISINVVENPRAAFSVITRTICENECVELNNNSFAGAGETIVSNLWEINDSYFFSNEEYFSVCELPLGSHDVNLVVEDANGCKDSLLLNDIISVKPSPVAGFSYSPDIVIEGEEVNIVNESPSVVEVRYELDDDIELIGPDFSYIYKGSGIDTIFQVVIDKYGCSDTAFQILNVTSNNNLYIPNAFSPNGNGRNELFIPVYTGSEDLYNYSLAIYNRWGQEIFYTEEINRGWNGIYNGALVKSGVYVYKLRYRGKVNKIEKIGHVSVLY